MAGSGGASELPPRVPARNQGAIIDKALKVKMEIRKVHPKNFYTILFALSKAPLGVVSIPSHMIFYILAIIQIHYSLRLTQPTWNLWKVAVRHRAHDNNLKKVRKDVVYCTIHQSDSIWRGILVRNR